MSKPTRILVADGHEIARRGIRSFLEAQPGWVVCGEASEGRETVDKARRLRPDVVVLDVRMPGLSGHEAVREIRAASPGTEILVLSGRESDRPAREALDAGARGCVLESDGARELVAAVDAVRHRRRYVTAEAGSIVIETRRGADAGTAAGPPGARRLTAREREVVRLLAEGRTSKQVAAALGISPKTAETHRSNIMRKLDLHSIGELVRFAIRERIVEL